MSTAKGDELFKKAEGHAKAIFFKDYEKANEYYTSAAAQYKLDKNYERAGEAYMRAGDAAMQSKNQFEATQSYVEAANAYKKVDVKKAGTMLQIAIQLNIDQNRLGEAARLEKDFAEALEEEGQLKGAIEHYKNAYKFFYAEDRPQLASQCQIKMAKIHGELDEFDVAAKLYEEIGSAQARGNLKHQAKEYFLRATLCLATVITNDNRDEKTAEVREAYENYQTIDPNIRHSREAEFIEKVLDSLAENNLELFDDAVSDLNDMRMLDDWKTHVLLVIKKNFEDLT